MIKQKKCLTRRQRLIYTNSSNFVYCPLIQVMDIVVEGMMNHADPDMEYSIGKMGLVMKENGNQIFQMVTEDTAINRETNTKAFGLRDIDTVKANTLNLKLDG